jgi:hypothetical protein
MANDLIDGQLRISSPKNGRVVLWRPMPASSQRHPADFIRDNLTSRRT